MASLVLSILSLILADGVSNADGDIAYGRRMLSTGRR